MTNTSTNEQPGFTTKQGRCSFLGKQMEAVIAALVPVMTPNRWPGFSRQAFGGSFATIRSEVVSVSN